MLSCHPDGPSYLPDSSTFQQYINAHPGCLGTHRESSVSSPYLPSSLMPKGPVHSGTPSNEYALEHEAPVWQDRDVVRAGSRAGCLPLTTASPMRSARRSLNAAFRMNTLTDVLNAVPVHKGGLLLHPLGTLHHPQGHRGGRDPAELQRHLPHLRLRPSGRRWQAPAAASRRRWMLPPGAAESAGLPRPSGAV